MITGGPAQKPREPWLAAALSLIAPGLGQLHAGRPVRAAAWFIVAVASMVGTVAWILSEQHVSPIGGLAWFTVLLASQWGSWLDAYFACGRKRGRFRRTRRPALAAALSLLFPGLGHLYVFPRRWWTRILFAPLLLAPGLALMAGETLEASAVPGWPRWLADWPTALTIPAGALLSVVAVAHSYYSAFRRDGHECKLPRMTRTVWILALAAWMNAQMPWETWLKHEVKSFRIPSSSMEPSLQVGDRLWAKRAAAFSRGDIVIFRPPGKPDVDYIKRVIGLPGERVQVQRGRVFINGRRLADPWGVHRDASREVAGRDYFGPVTVPPQSYFVMGDNRDNSFDSRYFGPVPASAAFGRAYKRYWPFRRASILK
jgi:signal peptidase I